MKTFSLTLILLALLLLPGGNFVSGQNLAWLTGADLNSIQTAVPFLTIAPDALSAGMGDGGVASKPDVNSQHWNAAKYAFIEGKTGVSFTFTPWLSNLLPDIRLYYLSGYYRINSKSTLSSSFRYFSLGGLSSGFLPVTHKPYEYAADLAYSRLFSDHFATALTIRYIYSDPLGLVNAPGGGTSEPGTSLAGDVGFYYQNKFLLGERKTNWALGLNLTNVGTPVRYWKDAQAKPIPTNLRIGARFSLPVKEKHCITLQGDLNKLLVPTPPVYESDTVTGDIRILRGKAAPESILRGMIQSFYDAPGVEMDEGSYSVFREEMYEIMYSLGLEYEFNNLLSIRSGYYHQHASKGNQKYFTLGIGGKLNVFSLDLSYLLPQNGQNSPLANTFRITLSAKFGTASM